MNGLFFTGTDTGVGKTLVAASVARLFRQQGRRFGVCKPVATGAKRGANGWLAEDTRWLIEAAQSTDRPEEVTRWALSEPVAPPVAASLQGINLTLDALGDAVRRQAEKHGTIVVEGVGGLLCPLTEKETIADLAKQLDLPLVIVTRLSLGTLNHTLLTLEVVAGRGLRIAGIVMNATSPPAGLADETNLSELQHRTPVPILAVVPYQGPTPTDVSSELSRVDWWGLSQA